MLPTASKRSKKKKSNQLDKIHQKYHKNQEQIATQNLFHVSTYENDHLTQNHQAMMFDSIDLQKNVSSCQKNQKRQNIIRYHETKRVTQAKSELEKFMDKQFIQESKLLLKLYSTMPEQYQSKSISPTLRIRKQKSRSKGKQLIVQNSLRSDAVFVAKKTFLSQSPVQKQNKRLKALIFSSDENKSQKKLPIEQVISKGYVYIPRRNYFKGTQDRFCMTKTLSPQYRLTRANLSEYTKIKRLKTLNIQNINLLYNSSSIRNQEKNYLKSIQDIKQNQEDCYIKQSRSLRKQDNSNQNMSGTFRRRHNFYKEQRKKVRNNVVNI